jgi:hypothetical protein
MARVAVPVTLSAAGDDRGRGDGSSVIDIRALEKCYVKSRSLRRLR